MCEIQILFVVELSLSLYELDKSIVKRISTPMFNEILNAASKFNPKSVEFRLSFY